MEFLPIEDIHEDYGNVLLVRFYRSEGAILGEPPEVGLTSCISSDFVEDYWDVFAVIDWNPAFELAESIDLEIRRPITVLTTVNPL